MPNTHTYVRTLTDGTGVTVSKVCVCCGSLVGNVVLALVLQVADQLGLLVHLDALEVKTTICTCRTPQHTTSHYNTSHHTTSQHTTSHYTTSHHTTAHHRTAHHTTAHHRTAHHTALHYMRQAQNNIHKMCMCIYIHTYIRTYIHTYITHMCTRMHVAFFSRVLL